MTTLFYGYQYASMSSSIRATRISGQTQSGRSLHGITGLPTPPGSTRPSIDEAIDTTRKTVSAQDPLDLRPSISSKSNDPSSALFGPAVSPPASVILASPPKTQSVENIILQLQPIFDSEARMCVVDGVTPALFEAIEANIIQGDQAGIWETLR
jgi:hypothetical protein